MTNNGQQQKITGNNGNGDKPLRIVEFRAQNTKVIKAVQIFPGDKDVVTLTGKNSQGKSTILDSIWMALSGKGHIPQMPIRTGEKKAEIYLDLGDFRITRKITGKSDSLKVESSDGHQVTSPQRFLSSCLADLAHNPLEFMRMKPKEQLEIVQGLFPLPVQTLEVERIAGLTAKTIKMGDNKILYLDTVSKALFEERTENNREVVRLEKVIESIQIPRALADIQPVSIAELASEKDRLIDHFKRNNDLRLNEKNLESKVKSIQDAISIKDAEIKEIETKLIRLRDERSMLSASLGKTMDEYFAASDQVSELIDPDFSDINRRIAEADSHNKQANEVQQQKAVLQKSKEDLDKASADSDKLTGQIEQLKAYKLRLIEQAKLPLPGLGFEDGRVIYNGLPLYQASGREQIEISCAICLAQHPKIGIVTIDVGWSDLDNDGKEVVREFARRTGAQIWVTMVKEEPGQEGFHIVAGELTAVDGVPVAEDCEDVPEGNTDGILVVDGQNEIDNIVPGVGPDVGLW